MKEIWKNLQGYEGIYKISNIGNIMSVKKSYLKKISISYNGYAVVSLHRNGISTTWFLHRLLAIHFVPNPNDYPIINHKNGLKQDNRIDNIEWCTYSDNLNHAYEYKLQNRGGVITDDIASKINEMYLLNIKRPDIAMYVGLPVCQINNYLYRNTYKNLNVKSVYQAKTLTKKAQ